MPEQSKRMNFLYTVFLVVMTINTVILLHDRLSGSPKKDKDKEPGKT